MTNLISLGDYLYDFMGKDRYRVECYWHGLDTAKVFTFCCLKSFLKPGSTSCIMMPSEP